MRKTFDQGGFYQLLPLHFQDKDNGDLEGLSSLVGTALELWISRIDEIAEYPDLQIKWFAEAWCEVLDFRELPQYLDWPQLRAILPWMLRLYKLKGTYLPIYLITEKVFEDADNIELSIQPYDHDTGNLVIELQLPEDFIINIEGATAVDALAQRISALYHILERFVPIYCNLVIAIVFPPFRESLTGRMTDIRLDTEFQFGRLTLVENLSDERLISEVERTFRQAFKPVSGGFILGETELGDSGLEGLSPGLSDGDLSMETP